MGVRDVGDGGNIACLLVCFISCACTQTYMHTEERPRRQHVCMCVCIYTRWQREFSYGATILLLLL